MRRIFVTVIGNAKVVRVVRGVAFLLLLSLINTQAQAEGKTSAASVGVQPLEDAPLFPKQIVLDGRTYSSKDLIDVFAEIAFSSYIRPNNFAYVLPPTPPHEHCAEPNTNAGTICGLPEEYKSNYPWLYEYLYRGNGVPRYFAINKFTGPIRISIGYPNDLFPLLSASDHRSDSGAVIKDTTKRTSCGELQRITHGSGLCISDKKDLSEQALSMPGFPRSADYMRAQQIVEQEVNAALPGMRNATGLPVSYVPHAQETADNLANVRIVLEDFGYNEKSAVIPSGMNVEFLGSPVMKRPPGFSVAWNSIFYRDAVEPALTTAVRFTPYTGVRPEEFVQGRDNTRQVDGYLLPNSDNSIGMSFCFIYVPTNERLPALVRECLIRSLGLPNAPQLVPKMILGLWNGDIPEQLRRIILGLNNPPADVKEQLVSTTEWGPSSPPITEFDSFIVKTLYNPSIRLGMSVPEFYSAVNRNKNQQMGIRRE